MPVPSSISDLSTTPSLNSPAGTESPSTVDDYLRTQAAFIKQVDDKATGAVKATDLAATGGSALVGYDGGTAQAVLDDAKPMANYTALRAYTGRATGVRITQAGLAGFFQRDASDTTSADNGGTIIVDAAGRRWKRLHDGRVNAQWFGAKGDWDGTAGADNTQALRNFFSLIHSSSAIGYTAIRTGAANAIKLFIPPGRYMTSGGLDFGESGKAAYFATLEMDGATIEGTYASGAPVLTLHMPTNCAFYGLSVFTNEAVSGLKVNNSKNSSYYNTKASSAGFAAIHLVGMQFNNTWENIAMNQNVGGGGSTWCWYWDCNPASVVPPATFAEGPINKITGMFMAAGINSMYWNYGINVHVDTVEHEGFETAVGNGVAQFYNCREFKLSTLYQEAFPQPSNSLYFEGCSHVSLENLHSGAYYHYTKFKNCASVTISNYRGGAIRYEGTNTDFDLTNIKVFAQNVRQALEQNTAGTFKRLQMKNVFVRNQTDTADVGQIALLSTGGLSQADNWLPNPRCVTALGNATTTYCSATDDPTYQEVSPLGFISTLVTITSTTNFPVITPSITTAKLSGAKTSRAVLVQCWKMTNLPAGISPLSFSSCGVRNSNLTAVGGEYGTLLIPIGDWLVSFSVMSVDAAATNVQLVWDYANKPPVDTKFLFGGAIVYGGSEIKFPMVD